MKTCTSEDLIVSIPSSGADFIVSSKSNMPVSENGDKEAAFAPPTTTKVIRNAFRFSRRANTIADGAINAVAAILPTPRAEMRNVKKKIMGGMSFTRPLHRVIERSAMTPRVPFDSAIAKSNVTDIRVKKNRVGNLEMTSSGERPNAKTPKIKAAKSEANPR